MPERWGICPRCSKGPRPDPIGVTRRIRLRCTICGHEFNATEPEPLDDGYNPLAMAEALRPLVEELVDLWGQLAERAIADDAALIEDILQAGMDANDEARMQWLRQQARYALGLDERPYADLKGRMMVPEVAAMRELIASKRVPVVPKPRPPARVTVQRVMVCGEHGPTTVLDRGLIEGHRWRCPRCGEIMEEER